MTESTSSRRDFIQKAVAFTAGGLALGGAAAVAQGLLNKGAESADSADLQTQLADSSLQMAQLQQSLSAAETELAALRPDYAAALSKNAELLNALSAKQQEADTALGALIEAQAEVDRLTQLIALYEKLEDGNSLDTLLKDGLAAASAGFAGALGLVPLVTAGAELARQLLDKFDFQIPNYRAGLSWLQTRMDEMNTSIASVEKAIVQALKTLDPIATAMSQLVDYILKYLPSNIGIGVKSALDAINLLYQSLPPVVTGTHDQVITMLTEPFAPTDDGLSQSLVKPIRERSLSPSEKLATEVESLNDSFTQSLHIPVQVALERRAAVIKEITDYRAANGL